MTNDKQRERLVELLRQIRGDEIAISNEEAEKALGGVQG